MAAASGILAMLLLLLLGDVQEEGASWYWRYALSGVLVGGMVGGGILIFGELYCMEMFAAAAYIDDLSNCKVKTRSLKIKFGIQKIVKQVEENIKFLQNQQRKVSSEKYELQVKMHLLEAEVKQLNSVLNSLNDSVVVTDAFNEVVIANAAAEKLFGFKIDNVRQKSVESVIDNHILSTLICDTREDVLVRNRRQIEQRITRGKKESIYDVTLSCVDNSLADAMKDSGVEKSEICHAGVVTILRDVTKEKEIAESKSDFVSNVSHELRTPLSSIKAYMEMLVDGEAEDEATKAKFYNIIQGETNRLSRLIDNMLNISRIESGVVRVQREHIKLTEVIREAVNIMQPQARAKQIELIENISQDCFQVFADRDMILQCVLNLLSNAVKYTLANGKVSLSVDVDEHFRMVRVAVADTGVGISEKDIPHLFDKFYRVADHKKLAKGTGLGLNMVRHVIETVHGGVVNVESTVNRGSTFTFALPIADTE